MKRELQAIAVLLVFGVAKLPLEQKITQDLRQQKMLEEPIRLGWQAWARLSGGRIDGEGKGGGEGGAEQRQQQGVAGQSARLEGVVDHGRRLLVEGSHGTASGSPESCQAAQ